MASGRRLAAGGRPVMSAAGHPRGPPITTEDIRDALAARIDDSARTHRCHLLALIYPLAACCWRGRVRYDMLPLLFRAGIGSR